jgi:hypothetical protein
VGPANSTATPFTISYSEIADGVPFTSTTVFPSPPDAGVLSATFSASPRTTGSRMPVGGGAVSARAPDERDDRGERARAAVSVTWAGFGFRPLPALTGGSRKQTQ